MRLISRGKFGEIVIPQKSEGDNNFIGIKKKGYNIITDAVKRTFNSTISEVVEKALNIPKELIRNNICFAPRIIAKIRIRQAQNKEKSRNEFQRRMQTLLALSSKHIILN